MNDDDLKLNLLPWRMAQRQLTLRNAIVNLIKCLFVAAILILIAHFVMLLLLRNQDAHNNVLSAAIKQLGTQAAIVQQLTNQQAILSSHSAMLAELNQNRQQIVLLLTAMANVTTDGIYLTSMNRQAQQITLIGRAVTMYQANQMLENIQHNRLFTDADLSNSRADATEPPYQYIFTLHMQLRNPA